jgi:signal transduction histidine kinase
MENEIINILVIDDDANSRRTLGKILKIKGYGVEEAGSGNEAISKVKNKFFNIAVVDVRLPDISGLELVKIISDINEDTIVITLTAYASLDTSIEAMNKGAYAYITKPLNMDGALLVIKRALEKQRLSMENKRLLKELKEANEKLKELDKRKSQFVANVSHEFKNPLAMIKESLGIVISGMVGQINAEQKEMLGIGKNSIERLIRLVTDLLDISKIEAGKMEMRREEFGICALVNGLIDVYKQEFIKKRLTLKEDIPQDIGTVWADKDKITEVIINLLHNAIKYTPAGGNINIKLLGSENEVRFEIIDSGPGIPRNDFDKIFDKFERIIVEKQEGTGLGLPIAKDIVELHKGKIWVESEVGKGSRFIFTIPRKAI